MFIKTVMNIFALNCGGGKFIRVLLILRQIFSTAVDFFTCKALDD
jgi:hypothetical protein